jgi:hypothetical protein
MILNARLSGSGGFALGSREFQASAWPLIWPCCGVADDRTDHQTTRQRRV